MTDEERRELVRNLFCYGTSDRFIRKSEEAVTTTFTQSDLPDGRFPDNHLTFKGTQEHALQSICLALSELLERLES